jgi:hypothetical protein
MLISTGGCSLMQAKTACALIYRPLLLLVLASLLAGPVLAQSPTPLSDLTIRLWPEYDRPQLLVIFEGTVAESSALPASLSFTLPADVQTPHAVAYLDETSGKLLTIKYDLVEGPNGKVLSFASPGRQFQFEYYSDTMLTTNGSQRRINFSFTASADVARLNLEVQQPTAAQSFTSTPPPSSTQVESSGLTVARYDAGPLAAGSSYSLQASYTRSSNAPSVGVNIPSSSQIPPVEVGGAPGIWLRENLGLIFVAAGLLLLTGALIYWFWGRRAEVVVEPARHAPLPRKRSRAGHRPARPAAEEKVGARAGYCHHCGAPFRDDEARFCYACGAERRSD